MEKAESIDRYIERFPVKVRVLLEQLRQTIREAAPDAEEAMNYGIPTFKLNGNLVHFAAYKSHIGFYPTPAGMNAFRGELAEYEVSKGTVRFPLDQPVPLDLVRRIVAFRVKEQMGK